MFFVFEIDLYYIDLLLFIIFNMFKFFISLHCMFLSLLLYSKLAQKFLKRRCYCVLTLVSGKYKLFLTFVGFKLVFNLSFLIITLVSKIKCFNFFTLNSTQKYAFKIRLCFNILNYIVVMKYIFKLYFILFFFTVFFTTLFPYHCRMMCFHWQKGS